MRCCRGEALLVEPDYLDIVEESGVLKSQFPGAFFTWCSCADRGGQWVRREERRAGNLGCGDCRTPTDS